MITIEQVEIAATHKIIYYVTTSRNICGKIESQFYEAESKQEMLQCLDHQFFNTSTHNLRKYKDCPICRSKFGSDVK